MTIDGQIEHVAVEAEDGAASTPPPAAFSSDEIARLLALIKESESVELKLTVPEPQQRSGLLTALVFGALIALVAANIYMYVQIDHVRTDVARVRESLMTELSNIRDASSVTSASQTRHLQSLKEELDAARAAAANSSRTMSSQAKAEAQAYADKLTRQLEAEQAKVQQQVSSEISDVKQTATAANAKIADVSTEVGTVKSQCSRALTASRVRPASFKHRYAAATVRGLFFPHGFTAGPALERQQRSRAHLRAGAGGRRRIRGAAAHPRLGRPQAPPVPVSGRLAAGR